MTRIVVLDGFTLNPGDLNWDAIATLGDAAIYDRSTPGEVLDRARDAEAVLTNKVPLDGETIAALPKLAYIGVTATGYNIVDVDAARRRGIVVTNAPSYGTNSVAQMAFAHLLHLTQNVAGHSAAVRSGRWSRSADFCFWESPLVELAGLTIGIVGFGQIGKAAARIARAFGMDVLAHTPRPTGLANGVEFVDLDSLFRRSDVVSLHCPLTPQTENLVDRRRLALMKPTAFLINTSRGPLIDEAALADALAAGQIAGAGLDVLAVEPPPPDHPLLAAANCSVTPHIAWATRASRARLLDITIENLAAYLAGSPINVVT